MRDNSSNLTYVKVQIRRTITEVSNFSVTIKSDGKLNDKEIELHAKNRIKTDLKDINLNDLQYHIESVSAPITVIEGVYLDEDCTKPQS